MVQRMLGLGAYLPWIRSHIIQAQYFKVSLTQSDPVHSPTCQSVAVQMPAFQSTAYALYANMML